MPKPSLFRKLVVLSLPVVGLNVLAVTSLLVDTAMCGRLPDADMALAGLGFATQLIFVLAVAIMGLNVGTIALVSRAHGGGAAERLNHIVAQSVALTLVIGVAVATLGNASVGPLIRLLGGSGASLTAGSDYLHILLLGSPFYYLMILLAGILRGMGETRTAFLAALIGNGLNIALNYGLILGNLGLPALGVEGAAIGTVASQMVNVAVLVVAIRRSVVPGLTVTWPAARLDRELIAQLFRLGWPAALDMLVLNISFLSVVAILGRLSDAAVAAHGIGLRIQGLAFLPGLGVAQATAALVGLALGAGAVARARETARAALLLCVLLMSVLGGVIVVAAKPIIAVFDVAAGTALAHYSLQWMWVLGLSMPIFALHLALVGVLQGAGSTRTALAINITAVFLIQIPTSLLLAFPAGLGALGAWLGLPISAVLKVLLSIAAYRRGHWAVVGVGR